MNINFEEFKRWEAATKDTIDVKKIYIDIADDLVSGVLLSQIIYWYLPPEGHNIQATKLRVKKEGKLWLAKGRNDWYDEARISPRQFDTAIKKLIDRGVVEKKIFKFNGETTIHIRIIEERFLELWEEMLNTHEYGNRKNQTSNGGITRESLSTTGINQSVNRDSHDKILDTTGINQFVNQESQNGELRFTKYVNPLTENTTETKKHECMNGVANATQTTSLPKDKSTTKQITVNEAAILQAILEGSEKIELQGFYDEFASMLIKNFKKQLDIEVIQRAFSLYLTKQVDLYGKIIDISNPTGFLHDCYKDALLQYKAIRYREGIERNQLEEELQHPKNYHFSRREKGRYSEEIERAPFSPSNNLLLDN
jgi:hypothetical protein